MQSENELSIGVRARILPIIEGADQLKNEISNLPSTISNRMVETVSSPAFKEGLSEQQVKKLEHLTGLTDTFEFQKIQERQKEITDDLTIDLDRGKLTASQQKKHLGRFAKYGQSVEGLGEFISTELDEPQFDFLSQSQKTILRTAATQGAKEAAAGISGVNQRFEQINYTNDYTRMIGRQESERGRIFRELDSDIDEGSLSKARGKRYLSTFSRQQKEIEEFQQSLQENFQDKDFITPMISASSLEMEKLRDVTKEFSERLKDAEGDSSNILTNLKKLSSYALGGMVIREGLNYLKTDAQIAAREKTSFDLSSPLGMESQKEKFDVYKENTERSRDYRIGGGVLGLAAGAAASVVTGGAAMPFMLAGFGFGNYVGSELAGIKNIERDAETDARLQRRSQIFSEIGSMVSSSSEYDILRARTEARIGKDAIGSLNLGYTPEDELRMRSSFADARGKYDPQLYKEQTVFARAEGIDPNAIYQMNLSARMTGMDTSLKGLDQAKQIATATYGENASSQRIIDILSDLKNLNERLLQTNLDMDSRDAMRAAIIPSMIFGDSPYGRLGEKAGDTTNVLSKLGQGDTFTKEAWLYSAYKVKDPLEFLERERKGSLDPENFKDIKEKVQLESNGNPRMARLMVEGLLDYDKKIPANMVPDIAKYMLSGEEPTKENLDKKIAELEDKYGKKVGNYQSDAESAVSETERNQSEIKKLTNTIGDSYRNIFNRMEKDWLSTWEALSITTANRLKLENELNQVLSDSKERFKKFFLDAGTGAEKGSEADLYNNKGKNRGAFDPPPIPENIDIDEIKEKLGRGTTGSIKNYKGEEEESEWVRDKFSKLQQQLSDSELGARYRMRLIEGYDPTGKGHKNKSAHYINSAEEGAFDYALYDKAKHKIIPKGEHPKEVKDFVSKFAATQGIEYGGNYKIPDENHVEYHKNKAMVERSDEYLAENKPKKENPKQNINRDKEFHKETFPLKDSIMNLGRIDPDILEHNKKLEELAKKRMPQQTAETLARAKESGIQVESEKPVSNKNIFEFMANDSAVEFAPKEKQHSFFEQNTETRANGDFNFDPNMIKEAIIQGFKELAGQNSHEPKEIIIRDRTINGITSEQAETTSKNANSIFGGSN